MYEYLTEQTYDARVIKPIQSDALRKMYLRQPKNGSKDSFIIAQAMRFGQYSETTLLDENTVALRQLTRFRMALADNCDDCKRRMIVLLDQVFPEYAGLVSDAFGTTSKELLLNYPTPDGMLAVPVLLAQVLPKNAFAFQIERLVERLMFLETQIEELDEQVSYLLHQLNQAITTIPGIGDTLGAIIVSGIGDINRFDAPNKLVAFAGLDVNARQSGEFEGTKQHISKRGSPYLRRAIWLAANRAAFCDPILLEYDQPLKPCGKHDLTAAGAVARKMCNILFTIFRENRPYEAAFSALPGLTSVSER